MWTDGKDLAEWFTWDMIVKLVTMVTLRMNIALSYLKVKRCLSVDETAITNSNISLVLLKMFKNTKCICYVVHLQIKKWNITMFLSFGNVYVRKNATLNRLNTYQGHHRCCLFSHFYWWYFIAQSTVLVNDVHWSVENDVNAHA